MPRSSSSRIAPWVSSSHGVPKRGFDQREAAAKKNAVGRARHHGFGSGERDGPTLLRFRYGARESFGVIAVSGSGTFIETRRRHGPVETDPAEFLPKENLQRGEIAIADQDLGSCERDAEAVEQIIRTIPAARTENSAGGGFGERFLQGRAAFGGGAGKKIAAREYSFRIELRRVAQARKFRDALLQAGFFYGAGK